MPDFLHARRDVKELLATLAAEKGYPPAVVEKDYWVMHCLWGLQQNGLRFEMKGGTSLSKGWGAIDRFSEDIDIRFEPPANLNTKGDKPAHLAARVAFFDSLAPKIKIPGIAVMRNKSYDDERAQNGGPRHRRSGCRISRVRAALPGLRPIVFLRAGDGGSSAAPRA